MRTKFCQKDGVFEMATDIQNTLGKALNTQLSNWAVVYYKLHHFHWYVKGELFDVLHAKFEDLYNLAAAKLDELAERMLTIGIKPVSSMKEYLASASIAENAAEQTTASAMLENVVSDFGRMAKELLEAADLAEDQANDIVTADLLREQAGELQKQVWMLNATLGK